jgi:hypothetical protein
MPTWRISWFGPQCDELELVRPDISLFVGKARSLGRIYINEHASREEGTDKKTTITMLRLLSSM